MHSLKPILNHWLQLQCQMVHDCSQGLLVQFADAGPMVCGIWPSDSHADAVLLDCARDVLNKQRLSLKKTDEDYFIGFPITLNGQFWGAVVLRLSSHNSEMMKAILKVLGWGTTWLQFVLFDYDTSVADKQLLVSHSSGAEPSVKDFKQQVHFLSSTLREPSFDETAIATVNFLCANFNFGRVSLGFLQAKKLELKAVSHSAGFDARTEPMQAIQEAMLEAIQQKHNIRFLPNDANTSTGVIVLAHQNLQEKHRLYSCSTHLLVSDKNILGAITIENPEPIANEEQVFSFLDRSLPSIADMMAIKNDSDKSIKAAVRRSSSRWLSGLFGEKSPLESVLLFCVLLFFIALFVPVSFHVSNNAVIESTNKYWVVAPYEGFIEKIHARPGDEVAAGEMLVKLKDGDLKLERRKLSSQLQQFRLEYDNALATGNRAQAAILNAQVEQSRIQLRLVEERLERVQLKSPIEGIVVSEDISQSLGAPVEQGQMLFEIADSSQYQVALFVEEKDIAYLNVKQHGQLSLKSLPGIYPAISISRITPLSELRDNKNYFRVDAELSSPVDALRPGMNGSAKIYVDKRPFGWILFHDFWHWLRIKLWV